jgi:hypothetical protein
MSATTQALMEQMEDLRVKIAAKQMRGEDATELASLLSTLQERLVSASQALTESKQILKG